MTRPYNSTRVITRAVLLHTVRSGLTTIEIISPYLTFKSLAVSLRTTRFNTQKFYMVLALLWVFCADLRKDSDFCFVHHKLIGFYNRGGKCLQRGTDWVFK